MPIEANSTRTWMSDECFEASDECLEVVRELRFAGSAAGSEPHSQE